MFDNLKPGTAQPSARHLAQMRLAVSNAGIPTQYADLMAEAGVTAASAESTAQGLAQLHEMTQPFVNSGRLDQAAMLRITRHALKAGVGSTGEKNTDRAQAIATAAGEETQAILAATEPPGHTARPVDPGALIVPARAGMNQATPSRAEAMADGLLARMQAGHVPSHGREYASMRLDDMARLTNGGNYASRRPGATMFGGAMGDDDFRSALAIASNKVLLDSYEASESQIKKASRQVSAPDFRPINTVRVSGGVELGKVRENGEFTAGVINDAGEAFAVETFGKIFALTRQALVNDDLGSFEQSSRMFGQGAALTEARLFAGLLEMNAGAGPTLSDNRTLFHADHGNRPASGGALSVETLSAARVAMRRQKGLSNEAIQVQPALLVVPPELETTAQKLVAEITAASVDEVNPFTDTLAVLVDAHLTSATRWYLAAKPGRPDGLQHAYLDGATGPQVFTREGFEVDATEFKVRLDFGCGFVDHRAWYMNPGA